MTWLAGILATRLGRYIAAGVLIIGALFGLRATWRGAGRAEAEREAREDDDARAIQIHERAAAARADRSGDPVERLREAGRLRD